MEARMPLKLRTHRLALVFAFVVWPAAIVHAEDPAQPNGALEAYARPAQLVEIGAGRRLNLRCAGNGAPTVILESGATADSMAWFKVQPLVAKFTRVCAYDRAGFGFSDGGPLPRDIDAGTRDLHALIRAANLATPVVLVGHSLGTNIVRRYTDMHPANVAAMVLLDPPPQHIAEFAPAWVQADDEQRAAGLAYIRKCEQGAEKHELDAPELDRCLRKPNPEFSAALNAALHASKSRPAFWQTIISVEETTGDMLERPVSPEENHGSIPLLVLVADSTYDDIALEDRMKLQAAGRKTNKLIAATSSRGEIIPVAHSSHDVQIDRPDAAVDAIRKAIKRAAAKPSTK